jgi:hypothetical protein
VIALFFAFILAAGAESPVEPPAYSGVAMHAQPSIATNGSEFLTAWNEGNRVYASRLDTTGALLDTTRITIGPISSTERPVVASDGTDYAVAFANERGLFAARVTRGGAVTQLRILAPVAARGLAIASDGATYLVTYEAPDHSLRGLLLDRDVSVLRETRLADAFVTTSRAVVASNRQAYVVAWQSAANELRIRVLDPNGRATGVEFTLPGVEPELSWDGFRYLLVRREALLEVSLVSNDGYVRELIAIAGTAGVRNAAIGSNGTTAVVVWRDSLQNVAVAASIDGAGGENRRDVVGSAAAAPWNAAVSGNASTIVALTPASATAHGNDTSGEPSPVITSRRAILQSAPAAVTLDNERLVVWNEGGGMDAPSTSIRGQLAVADGPVTRIALRDGVAVGAPAVAAGGFRSFLTVWNELTPAPGYVVARRISTEGELLDEQPIIVAFAKPLSDPAVVWDGSSFVVFTSLDEQTGRGTVGASRVSGLGRSDPAPAPLSGSADAVDPAAASDGTRTLVAWAERDTRRIAGRFFFPNGSMGPVLTLASGFDDRAPRVAANGNGFLVVWSRANDGLRAVPVTANGLVGGELPIETGRAILEKDVAWNGDRYTIAWTDRFGPFTPAAYGRLVTADGRIEGNAAQLFFADAVIGQPDLFAGGAGRVELAYTRRAAEPLLGGADRIFTRPLFPIATRRHAAR